MDCHGYIFRRACGRALAAVLAVAVGSTAFAEPPKPLRTIEGITEYRLDNGLQVLLFPDDSRPTVTVNLTLFVGSRHEGYGETGMAHLLEHMLFKGAPEHPDIPKSLQERGARFNGTTWLDRTNYYETLPAAGDNLEFALGLEADRMMNSFIRREDLASEMTVVRNEFEIGENSPPQILNQRMMAAAFEWHNYGKSTIGNRSDIERVPVERLRAFYEKHYQPDNAMLVVAGRFKPELALAAIEDKFGAIPRPRRELDQTYTEEPAQDGERTVTLRRVGDVGVVGVMYHVPSGRHPDAAALALLEPVLSRAPAGRLHKALVETGKAASVRADFTGFFDPGVFEIAAEVPKDKSLDEVRDVLLEQLETVIARGVSQQEVDRARQQYLNARERQAADTTGVAIQLSEWAAQGDWRLFFLMRDAVEKVQPADVQRVAATYLQRNNRTLGMFVPTEKAERVSVPGAPDLAPALAEYKGRQKIEEGEQFTVTPANIERRTRRGVLASGIKTALLPKKNRGETVALRLTLRYGNLDNLKGYETAATLLPDLMLRGAGELSRQEIQDKFDAIKTTIAASGTPGVADFRVQTDRTHLSEAVKLLIEIVREPTFPAAEFDELRRQELAQIEEQRSEPQALAILAVQRAVSPYDKDDVRYIATMDETAERLRALSGDRVRELHAFLSGANGELTIVGDFDPEQVVPSVEEGLSGWTTGQEYARLPRKLFDVGGERIVVSTPDKANAMYVAGEAFGVQDSDPDYPALAMGNFVLGGGTLSSRLGNRVRQKEGLSYGVGSMFGADAFDRRASLTIYAMCQPDNMPKVEAAIAEEFALLLEKGVSTEELDRAKAGYLQQQQVARSRDETLTNALGESAYVGRTFKFQEDLEKAVSELTPEQVIDALQKHLSADRLVIVAAGDFKEGAATTPAKQEAEDETRPKANDKE